MNVSDFTARSHIVISFRFRSISFSKKRALAFFLAIELLTNRKCVASLSSRNIQAWKIRKGILVGCKVTLRNKGQYDFLNLLSFTIPRIEKLVPRSEFISNNRVKYYQMVKQVKKPNLNVNTTFILTVSELILFYPIELGLGLHPDVRQVVINFIFSSTSIEERYFFLREAKVPVRHLAIYILCL